MPPLTSEYLRQRVDSIIDPNELDKRGNGKLSIAIRALELLLKSDSPVSWTTMKRRTGSLYPNYVAEVLNGLREYNIIDSRDNGYGERSFAQNRKLLTEYTLTPEGRETAEYVHKRIAEISSKT